MMFHTQICALLEKFGSLDHTDLIKNLGVEPGTLDEENFWISLADLTDEGIVAEDTDHPCPIYWLA